MSDYIVSPANWTLAIHGSTDGQAPMTSEIQDDATFFKAINIQFRDAVDKLALDMHRRADERTQGS